MLRRTHELQYALFTSLDQAKRDRQALADLQTRVLRMHGEIDEAMTAALGSTLEFFKAGGQ